MSLRTTRSDPVCNHRELMAELVEGVWPAGADSDTVSSQDARVTGRLPPVCRCSRLPGGGGVSHRPPEGRGKCVCPSASLPGAERGRTQREVSETWTPPRSGGSELQRKTQTEGGDGQGGGGWAPKGDTFLCP